MGLFDGLLSQPGVTATGGGYGYDPSQDYKEVRFTEDGTPYNANPDSPLIPGHTRASPLFDIPTVEVPTEPSLLNYGDNYYSGTPFVPQDVSPTKQVDVNPTQEQSLGTPTDQTTQFDNRTIYQTDDGRLQSEQSVSVTIDGKVYTAPSIQLQINPNRPLTWQEVSDGIINGTIQPTSIHEGPTAIEDANNQAQIRSDSINVNPMSLYNRQGRADYTPQNIVDTNTVFGSPSLGSLPNPTQNAYAEEQWYNDEQAKQDASAMEALNRASAERDKQAQIEAQLQALLKAQGLDNRAEWDMRRANDQFTNLDKQYDVANQVATDDFGKELFNANEHGQTSYDINAIKQESLDNLMMKDREPVVAPPVVTPTDNKPNYPSHLTPYAINLLEEQRKRNEMFQGIGDTAVDMYEGAKTLGSDAIQGAQDLYQDFTKPDTVVEPTPTSADDLNLFDILGETDELVKKDDKKPDLSHLTPWAREQIESQNARNEFFQGVGDTASDIVKGTVGGPAINWYNNLSKDAEGEKQKYSGNEDIGGLMRQNFGQNFAEIVKGGVDAAISPIETADAIASLVSGAVQHTLPDDMAWNDESKKMASAVADIYAERYGSLEGFKKALAENPAEVLLELTGAGLITKAGVVKLTQKIKGNPDFIRDLNLGETIDKGVTKFLPGMKKEIFSGANSGRPWKMTSKGDGDFYIQRVGPNAGKVSKTRNGPSDIAFSVDQDVLLPDYAYYAVMSIEKKLQARAHGTAQQAINHKDVDAVLTDLFQNMNKSESKVDDGVLGQVGEAQDIQTFTDVKKGDVITTYHASPSSEIKGGKFEIRDDAVHGGEAFPRGIHSAPQIKNSFLDLDSGEFGDNIYKLETKVGEIFDVSNPDSKLVKRLQDAVAKQYIKYPEHPHLTYLQDKIAKGSIPPELGRDFLLANGIDTLRDGSERIISLNPDNIKIIEKVKGSSSKVDDGVLGQKPVEGFHGTKEEYVDYGFGKNNTDPGWHFGSNKSQAKERLKSIDIEENINPYTGERARELAVNPVDSPKGHKIISNDLNVNKPLRVYEIEDPDFGAWDANSISTNVLQRGELPKGFTQADKVAYTNGTLSARITKDGKQVDIQLKDIDTLDLVEETEWIDNFLDDRGYDGLVYENAFEGKGDSYAVYHLDKIKQTGSERYAKFAIPTGGLLGGEEETQSEELTDGLINNVKSWKPNNNLVTFVKTMENDPLRVGNVKVKEYDDVGHKAKGYGTKSGLLAQDTEAEASKAMSNKLVDANKAVDRLVKIDLNKNQRNALVSLVYNVGATGFGKSNALKELNKGNIKAFLKEAFDPKVGFVRTKGKIVKGLVNRRAREKMIFTKGNYGN